MKPSILPLGLAGLVTATAPQPVETTRHGSLLGGACATTNVNFFYSIPNAKPPIENLRFQAPRLFGHFGNRNATVKAPACTQFGTTLSRLEYSLKTGTFVQFLSFNASSTTL